MAATAGDGGAACPAYPWPNDGAQRGGKVFMQSDCAACHGMLPYASPAGGDAARAEAVEAKVAEIVVVEKAQPAAAAPLAGGSYSPDLAVITRIQQGLRGNLYSAGGAMADAAALCQELKKRAAASPVWL